MSVMRMIVRVPVRMFAVRMPFVPAMISAASRRMRVRYSRATATRASATAFCMLMMRVV
jgi:hypothetical protein